MNCNVVIVVVLQFMIACSTLNCQAAAPDRDKAPDQLWSMDRELSQDCLKYRDRLRVKDNRQVRIRDRSRMLTMFRQSDLLQELLPPRDRSPVSIRMKKEKKAVHGISYSIDTQETGLLEELIAEASMP